MPGVLATIAVACIVVSSLFGASLGGANILNLDSTALTVGTISFAILAFISIVFSLFSMMVLTISKFYADPSKCARICSTESQPGAMTHSHKAPLAHSQLASQRQRPQPVPRHF